MLARWRSTSQTTQSKRYRTVWHSTEQLEPRCLLAADLVAHWRADDLVTLSDDGQAVRQWTDRISGVHALAAGQPRLVPAAFGNRNAIRFDPSDGDDSFTVSGPDSPLSNAGDFSVVVAFSTSSSDLVGANDEWFKNSGLVDANSLGFTEDWGISLNQAGQISAGMGSGFLKPTHTVYSSQSALNDGQVHLATLTRKAGTLSVYVDDLAPVVRHDADSQPRARLPVFFGSSAARLPFSGDITEVRFFDGELGPEEVAATHGQILAPVATDDSDFALDGAPLAVSVERGVLTNDADLDAAQLAAVLSSPAQHGTVTLSADGSFTYQPEPGFAGVDTFSYQARDGQSLSEAATVSVVINSLDDQRMVVVNELHTDPVDETEFVEFIELHNAATVPVQLSGWYLTDAVDFVFPADASIPAGGHIVVAQNSMAFAEKYGVSATGEWEGRLRNSGEVVELRTNQGVLIDRVDYQLGFPWPTVGESGETMQLMNAGLANDVGGAWRSAAPTPAQVNSVVLDNAPPQIRQVAHSPEQPRSGQPVTVTAHVTDADGMGAVELAYQLVAPGSYIRLTDAAYETNWVSVPMADDGTQGDAVPSDGIYTVTLPTGLQIHRQLVRYRITASDAADAGVTVPYEDDPQPNFAYFVYDGVPEWTAADRPGRTDPVTFSTDVMNQLPAYQLIADATDVENSQFVSRYENRRFPGTMVYDGHVYDHIEFRIRGEFSTYWAGKNKWKFFFNRGHSFQARDNYGREYDEEWSVMNFSAAATPWVLMNRGMAGTGEAVAYRLYDLAGSPSPNTNYLQFRVVDDVDEAPEDQYEGDLWGLYLAIEHPDGRFLDERGLPDGTTYKVEGASGDIKNQGPTQPDSRRDVITFMREANRTNTQEWWEENVDLDAYFTFRAINRAVNNMDIRDGWNHYLYHNPETNKWTVIPWDLDMLYVPSTHWSGVIRLQNSLRHDQLDIAYRNRARELQDLLFSVDQIGPLVGEYAGFVNPQTGGPTMADVDRFMWNFNSRSRNGHRSAFDRRVTNYNFARGPDGNRELISGDHEGFAQWLKDFMLPSPGGGSTPAGYGARFLSNDARDTDIPDTPTIQYSGAAGFPADALQFSASAFQDQQGDAFAAMEWRIGPVTDPDAPGFDPTLPLRYEVESVWESGEIADYDAQIEIPPDVVQPGQAYRARVRMLDSTGRWSHWSDPAEFIATAGTATELTGGLRISEIHYNPAGATAAELAAGHLDNDDFEFIELTNVGEVPIDLRGARFVQSEVEGGTQGMAFDFSAGQVTVLSPGQRVVVAEDIEAFAFRYGDDLAVAGQWSGRLSNGGEQLTLLGLGATIQQFSYSDQWYAETDGGGMSLEIVNVHAGDPARWAVKEGWRPSAKPGGTPGSAGRVIGDSNSDGLFDSSDLVAALQAGEYEDGIGNNSTFEEGDWDGDGDFTSSDLVLAFQFGTYQRGAPALATRSLFDTDEVRNQRSLLSAALIDTAFGLRETESSSLPGGLKDTRPEFADGV